MDNLSNPLMTATAGFVFISETDSPIVPFQWDKAGSVTSEIVLSMSGSSGDSPTEEQTAEAFFEPLTQPREWHGELEKKRVERFKALYALLSRELENLRVFKIGRIQIDIFVVGIDRSGHLAGVRTKAVET